MGNVIGETGGGGATGATGTTREYIYLYEAEIAPTMGSRTVVDRPLSVVNAVNTTPVTVASASPEPPVRRSEPESPMVLSRIEIVLRDGRVVRVDADVDGGKLAAIIAALEAKV